LSIGKNVSYLSFRKRVGLFSPDSVCKDFCFLEISRIFEKPFFTATFYPAVKKWIAIGVDYNVNAPTGHSPIQAPQSAQAPSSTTHAASGTARASQGQISTHAPQPVHALASTTTAIRSSPSVLHVNHTAKTADSFGISQPFIVLYLTDSQYAVNISFAREKLTKTEKISFV
jgi:hypothetical protein